VDQARQRAPRRAAIPGLGVRTGDGTQLAGESFDAIFVNAGATEVLPSWLDLLRPGGRLLLPLTVSLTGMNAGAGRMLLVRRNDAGYTAEFGSMVGVYHCTGARSEAGDQRLRARLGERLEGRRRLSRDAHAEGPDCWLHGDGFCLSQVAN
jgi:protein-L-isoaspartate(D-aspartate) O-methyltransferase